MSRLPHTHSIRSRMFLGFLPANCSRRTGSSLFQPLPRTVFWTRVLGGSSDNSGGGGIAGSSVCCPASFRPGCSFRPPSSIPCSGNSAAAVIHASGVGIPFRFNSSRYSTNCDHRPSSVNRLFRLALLSMMRAQ